MAISKAQVKGCCSQLPAPATLPLYLLHPYPCVPVTTALKSPVKPVEVATCHVSHLQRMCQWGWQFAWSLHAGYVKKSTIVELLLKQPYFGNKFAKVPHFGQFAGQMKNSNTSIHSSFMAHHSIFIYNTLSFLIINYSIIYIPPIIVFVYFSHSLHIPCHTLILSGDYCLMACNL